MKPSGYSVHSNPQPHFVDQGGHFQKFIPPQGYRLIALGSGILMSLALAPLGAWFFAWIAIAPLWILVSQVRSSSSTVHSHQPHPRLSVRLRTVFFYGLVWGIGYYGLALAWIRDLHPLTWMGIPWLSSILITVICWLLITLWGALLPALWALLFHWLTSLPQPNQKDDSPVCPPIHPPLHLRLLIGTTLWCLLQTLWSNSVLDWTAIGLSQSPHNLLILHLGQLSGPVTVSLALVLFNGLVAEAWVRSNRQLFQVAVIVLVGAHLLGYGLYSRSPADLTGADLKIGIIQGNVPTRIKHFETGVQLALQNYTQGYETLIGQGVDAVLTPEGSFPWLWLNTPQQEDNPLYQAIQAWGIPAWVGTVGTRDGQSTQTLFTLTGTGEVFSRYDKAKLVPLGEYIPWQSGLGSLIGRLSPIAASMVPGSLTQEFNTPFGQAIAAICYDSAFPQVFRNQAKAGGQFILTASNNDPYGKVMMSQHHAQDVMRAIETDRWAVRATNTGFSGVVDRHGKTLWLSEFRTYQTHAHRIFRRQTQTLYVQWGNWLTPLLAIGSLIGLGRHLRR